MLLFVAFGGFTALSYAQNNARVNASLIQEIQVDGKTYMVVTVNTKTFNLELHNTGKKPLGFEAHAAQKLSNKEAVVFAISAAPVKAAGLPLGLILKDGSIRTGGTGFVNAELPLDSLKGIFSFRKDNAMQIAASSQYKKTNPKVGDFNFAIESSPVLMQAGKIMPALENVPANGVLSVITLNSKGEVLFVISKGKVSFKQMATVVTTVGGKDALVMRGNDSSFYTPQLGAVNEKKNSLGPVFLVSHSMEQSGVSLETNSEKKISEELSDVTFLGKRYIVCKVNTKDYDIRLFNKTPDGRGVYDFTAIDNELTAGKQNHIFSMNAGMFSPQRLPIGLFMVNGEEHAKINLNMGDPMHKGNFYDLPPNGIFAIDKKGEPQVITTDSYVKNYEPKHEVVWATQSGPMMLINGKFNEAFNQGSKNLNIRNGVGVNKKGEIILVISLEPVNFYEFTQLFKEQYACDNALYLDGAISQWYAPKVNESVNRRVQLGPLLTVIKK